MSVLIEPGTLADAMVREEALAAKERGVKGMVALCLLALGVG